MSNQTLNGNQYPEPTLRELCPDGLRDLANGLGNATPQITRDAAAELGRRTTLREGSMIYVSNADGQPYRAWAYGTSHMTARALPLVPGDRGLTLTNEQFNKQFTAS